MLQLKVKATDLFDENKQEFISVKEQTLVLEHSLVSLSKWEAKWCKPFLGDDKRTIEETLDYIRCMTITQNVDPNVYLALSDENIKEVNEYINAPMTATWFNNYQEGGSKMNKDIVTSELIYYWMIALQIPFECQKWHLNRLLTLVKVCNIKNSPKKKMARKDQFSQQRALNEARKKRLNTNG